MWRSKQTELDDSIIRVLEKKLNDDNEQDYAIIMRRLLEETQAKSSKNKNKHFGYEITIIILTATMTVINALILARTESIDCLGFLSILIPGIITVLLAIQNLKKHEETWLRHQKTYLKYQTESIQYIFGLGKYEQYENGVKAYQDAILKMSKGNIEKFHDNMNKLEKIQHTK